MKMVFLIILSMIFTTVYSQNLDFKLSLGNKEIVVRNVNDNYYDLMIGSKIRRYKKKNFLRFNFSTFDPLEINIDTKIDESLKYPVTKKLLKDDKKKYPYILQFKTIVIPEFQKIVEAAGCEIKIYQPDNALIVIADKSSIEKVKKYEFVRWVGKYHPVYKLEIELYDLLKNNSNITNTYSILLFKKSDQENVAKKITNLGGQVTLRTQSSRFEASLSTEQLLEVAGLSEVMFIDKATEIESDMDHVREIEGANYLELVKGYTGQGVSGEVCDGGLLESHIDFQNNPPVIHGSNDADNSHGTSVYGIVFGSGTGNNNARGFLPDALKPIFSSRHHISDRYAHTAELVDPNGPYRAVFQTNSWGSSETTYYTTISAEMDEILFDNDIVVTQSQANEGTRDSRPQAWAKNIISVGGIRGGNTFNRGDDYWDGASIGPANDGRIKPDLSNYYGNIFTTSNAGTDTYKEFGGTSGATPATAGCFGLLFQMWADGVFARNPGQNRDVFDSRPHMTTAKAIMINMAFQYEFKSINDNLGRFHQGWGFPDVHNIYETAKAYNWSLPILINEERILKPLEEHSFSVYCDGYLPLKITLVYADPKGNPSASKQLINNLDLKVISPSGQIYYGNYGLNIGNWSIPGGVANSVDNVENVFINNPEKGEWEIKIIGSEIVQDSHLETQEIDADYALVATGCSRDNNLTSYQLNIESNDGGYLTSNSLTNRFIKNYTAKIYCEEKTGWMFNGWSGDIQSSDNPLLVNVVNNLNISPIFEKKYNSLGNTEVFTSTSTSSNRRAISAVLNEDGEFYSLAIYHEAQNTGKMILAIYDDDNGPKNRIATTGEVDISTNKGWQIVSLQNNVTLKKGTRIWISWVFENNPGIKYKKQTGGCVDALVKWPSRMPEKFGNWQTRDYTYSVYALYNSMPSSVTEKENLPENYKLLAPYPNPFNPTTNISYSIKAKSKVKIDIYNSLGQLVKNLVNEEKEQGIYNIRFNGYGLSSGVYFTIMSVNGKFLASRKIALIK